MRQKPPRVLRHVLFSDRSSGHVKVDVVNARCGLSLDVTELHVGHGQRVVAPGFEGLVLVDAVENATKALGYSHRRITSGAGHDAMNMAALCPYAMIFVPSEGGISHAPDEFTLAAECIAGGRVLLATLLDLDEGV